MPQQPYGWARPWPSPYPVPPYFQPPCPFIGFPQPWPQPYGYPYAPQYPPQPSPYPPPQYPGGYPGTPYARPGQGRKMRTRNLVLVIVAAILVIGGGVAAAVLLTGESKSSFKLGNGTALGAKIDFKNMVLKQYGSTLTLTGSYNNKAKKEGNAYITVQAIKKGSEEEVSFTVPIVKGSSKSFTAKKTVSYKLSGATLGSILFKGEESSEEDGTNPPEDGNVEGQASFKLGNGTTPDGTIKIIDIELQQSGSKLTLTGYYDNVSNKVGNVYVTVKAAKDGSEEEIKFTFALVKGISNMFTEKKTVSYKLGGATLGSIGFEGEGGTGPPGDENQRSPSDGSPSYESTPDSESTSPTQ